MTASYYRADSENGDHMDDPSEDGLFMMIEDLNKSGNRFVVIRPEGDDPAWSASVTVQEQGGYEVVRRDTTRGEHEVISETSMHSIAHDLTVWFADRF